jgi:hypothetical protein
MTEAIGSIYRSAELDLELVPGELRSCGTASA